MKPSIPKGHRPALIIVGGFAGSGKSTAAKRLSSELGIARLSSDTIGQIIKESSGTRGTEINASHVAYDVLFGLSEAFIQSGVSVILDMNMGWAFQWQACDNIIDRHPQTLFLPVVLRCPHEHALERIRKRHQARPDDYDPPEVFISEEKHWNIWNFLQALDRSEVYFVDATGDEDQVYGEVEAYVLGEIDKHRTGS